MSAPLDLADLPAILEPERSAVFVDFDGTLADVAARVEGVADRPSVLYLNPVNMT